MPRIAIGSSEYNLIVEPQTNFNGPTASRLPERNYCDPSKPGVHAREASPIVHADIAGSAGAAWPSVRGRSKDGVAAAH